MNLFRFLKSTKGAIKPLNALLISGAAGAVFFYTVNTAANKQIEAERAVRTLTNIEGTAPQQGMRRQGDLLTSINVRDGRNQLATADERAALKGNSPLDRYEANQRALSNMDNSLGRAAQFSESEGLNTGNRNAVQSADRFVVGNPNARIGGGSVEDSSIPAGSTGNTGNVSDRRRSHLQAASMARSSGSSFGGSSGAVSGGISAQGSDPVTQGEAPVRLSGAMPGGSNIVSQRASAGLGGNNTASFGAGRNARITRSHRSGGDANELKDIVKKSAAAARNTSKDSANEGGRAFLANAVTSGGVQVGGAGKDPTASSGDLAPTDHKLKAIGNRLDNIEDEQEERNNSQKALIAQLLATIVGSIGMMVAGALILNHYDKLIHEWLIATGGAPWGQARWWQLVTTRWIIASAMMATVAAANAWLFARAAKFISKYQTVGGVGIAKLATILAPIMVAGMVFTAIKPTGWSSLFGNIWGRIKAAFEPIGLLTGQVTNGIMGLFK